VSQKNCANLSFAPFLSNMNRFQQKLYEFIVVDSQTMTSAFHKVV